MRVFAAVLHRAFWIGICFAVLTLMFVGAFTHMSGWPVLLLSLIGIMIGFSVLSLATAPVRSGKEKRPVP